MQVCGIFVLFLGGAQVLMWWGLHCFPTLRMTFAVMYYTTAAFAVLSSVQVNRGEGGLVSGVAPSRVAVPG